MTYGIRLLAIATAIAIVALAGRSASAEPAVRSTAELEKRVGELEGKVRSLEDLNHKMQRLSGEGQDWFERIDQQVKVIDRRLENQQEAAREKAKTAPVVELSPQGFWIRTPDDNFKLRVGGWIQADGRYFTGDTRGNGSTFEMRRVRPMIEGTAYKHFDYRVMMDFGRGNSVLQDAYLDAHYVPWFRQRVGKFKAPVGLERLQDDRYLMFAERAYPTQLVPDRDIGVQLWGDLLDERATYQLAVVNGSPQDNVATSDFDNNNAKDFAGRFFLRPFRKTEFSFAQGLGFGLSGTYGNARSATIDSFRSAGQTSIFTYNTGVVAAGYRYRISPQVSYLWGPFSAQSEWVQNTLQIGLGANTKPINNQAFQLAGAYLLTGDDATFSGVKPRRKFDLDKREWGALELTSRVSGLYIDRDAFNNGFANRAKSVRDAFEWGVGFNWYLNDNVKLQTDFFRTRFTGGSPGRNRSDESVVINELQLTF